MHNCIWGAKVQFFYETHKFFITFIAFKLVFQLFSVFIDRAFGVTIH